MEWINEIMAVSCQKENHFMTVYLASSFCKTLFARRKIYFGTIEEFEFL